MTKMALARQRLIALLFSLSASSVVLAEQAESSSLLLHTERSCAVVAENGRAALGSRALLQVSKPGVQSSKLQPAQMEDAPPKSAESLKSRQKAGSAEAREEARGANAFSFIQTAEVVEGVGSKSISIATEVRLASLRGWTDTGVFQGAVLLLASSLCWIGGLLCGRSCLSKETRTPQVLPEELPRQLPSPVPAAHDSTNLEEPSTLDVPTTFAIPQALQPECQPPGEDSETLASSEMVESCNMQGALMSWLSLLLHEKEGAEAPEKALEASETVVSKDSTEGATRLPLRIQHPLGSCLLEEKKGSHCGWLSEVRSKTRGRGALE